MTSFPARVPEVVSAYGFGATVALAPGLLWVASDVSSRTRIDVHGLNQSVTSPFPAPPFYLRSMLLPAAPTSWPAAGSLVSCIAAADDGSVLIARELYEYVVGFVVMWSCPEDRPLSKPPPQSMVLC